MALTSFYPQPGSSIFSTVTMTKKCTVSSCKSNYDSEKKKGEEYLTIFSFPRDPTDLESWLRAIPTKLPRTWEELKYRGVCHLHWPEDVPLKQNGRHKYPAVPPSIFSSEIAASILSSPPPPPRTTTHATSDARNPDIDEMQDHLDMYNFSALPRDEFLSRFTNEIQPHGKVATGGVTSGTQEIVLLSNERDGPVFQWTCFFTLSLKEESVPEVSFVVYKKLKKIKIPSLTSNIMRDFTALEALVHYVVNMTDDDLCDRQLEFIERQIQLINIPKNGSTRIYSEYDMIGAFTWYAQSRSLYEMLREKIKLPSINTLNKISSLAAATSDADFFKKFFINQEVKHRMIILLVDEIYVKASIIYAG